MKRWQASQREEEQAEVKKNEEQESETGQNGQEGQRTGQEIDQAKLPKWLQQRKRWQAMVGEEYWGTLEVQALLKQKKFTRVGLHERRRIDYGCKSRGQ
eukprot:10516804-Karenia_brevis.AAC.1